MVSTPTAPPPAAPEPPPPDASAAPAAAPAPAPPPPAAPPAPRQAAPDRDRASRVHELDTLRGFAMTGIVFMNILQITGMPRQSGPSAEHVGAAVFEQLFDGRFYPIFSFLFGLSFALFLDGAASRHEHPRLLLIRRLVVLGAIGALHTLLQPGEVLKFYAAFGLAFLLPATYLSRRWVLGLGVVLTVVPLVLSHTMGFVGGTFAIPGLFLLGLAAGRYELARTLPRRGRQLAAFFAVALVAAGVAAAWQWAGGVGEGKTVRIQIVGVVVAAAIGSGFLLLLRTPAGRPLSAVFAPLGRMALTNYLLATLLIVLGDRVLDVEAHASYGRVVLFGVGIGVVQAVLSPLWLRRFRYGPAEWLWRCLTWWQRVPLRRADT
jgi:uncharacterized protein